MATLLGALGVVSVVPAHAETEVEALKRELSEQRELINKLLAAQASQKETLEKIEARPQQAAATQPAAAKSSILPEGFTPYATLDVNVSNASSGYGRKTTVGSGGMTQSSFGVKLDKPIGEALPAAGPLHMVGEIEMGIDLSTGVAGNGANAPGVNANVPSSGAILGNGSQLFARQAYAGVSSDYGQILLGRQYAGTYIAEVAGTAFGVGFYGNNMLFLPPIGGSPSRFSNAIVLRTPTFSGLSLQFDWTAGSENNVNGAILSGASTVKDNSGQGWDLTAFYHNGPVSANLATWNIKNTSYATGETGLATKKGWVLAGNYDFGFAKLFGTYMMGTIKGGNYQNVTQTLSKANGWAVSTSIPIDRHTFIASYSGLNDKSLQNHDANLFGIGYTYRLYDKTWFYLNWARLKNKGNSTYSLMNGGDLVGNIAAPGVSPSAFMIGINTRF